MKIQIFGSSSAGNCIRVYDDECPGVYFDAGVNPATLMAAGAPLANMPFFITHEHGDHARHVTDLRRKYGARIYATPGTALAIFEQKGFQYPIYTKPAGHFFEPWGGVHVWSVPIVHYPAADPVSFIIEMSNGERFLYLVDCGQIPDQESIPQCDYYFVEANYTPAALAKNNQQWIGVKARVQSGFGHLSVLDAYEFLKPRLNHAKKIILGHVSRNNFDLQEYEQLIPEDLRTLVTLASPGLLIDTDPF